MQSGSGRAADLSKIMFIKMILEPELFWTPEQAKPETLVLCSFPEICLILLLSNVEHNDTTGFLRG
jgi:hypothetical protein